jgi:NADH:ubiquinone oxidoreductase subunit K
MHFCAKRNLNRGNEATHRRGSGQVAAQSEPDWHNRPAVCAPQRQKAPPPMTPTLQLFCIGLLAALSRRHAIFILIGIELMLAAANLNFIAFWRFGPQTPQPIGVMVAIFAIAIAAAEAAVGLAMVIAVYRHYRTTNVDELDQLKG